MTVQIANTYYSLQLLQWLEQYKGISEPEPRDKVKKSDAAANGSIYSLLKLYGNLCIILLLLELPYKSLPFKLLKSALALPGLRFQVLF